MSSLPKKESISAPSFCSEWRQISFAMPMVPGIQNAVQELFILKSGYQVRSAVAKESSFDIKQTMCRNMIAQYYITRTVTCVLNSVLIKKKSKINS